MRDATQLEKLARELEAKSASQALPYDIEKWLITIKAHCTVIADPGPDDVVKELAMCIKIDVDQDLRPAIETLARENVRLNQCLKWEQYKTAQANGTTHSENCHTWGPQHYECLLRKFEEASEKLSAIPAAGVVMPPEPGIGFFDAVQSCLEEDGLNEMGDAFAEWNGKRHTMYEEIP
jgi:hypothetical protein